jgi:hypothetical protein
MRHMSQEDIIAVVDALYKEVEGNKSVRATIEALFRRVHSG